MPSCDEDVRECNTTAGSARIDSFFGRRRTMAHSTGRYGSLCRRSAPGILVGREDHRALEAARPVSWHVVRPEMPPDRLSRAPPARMVEMLMVAHHRCRKTRIPSGRLLMPGPPRRRRRADAISSGRALCVPPPKGGHQFLWTMAWSGAVGDIDDGKTRVAPAAIGDVAGMIAWCQAVATHSDGQFVFLPLRNSSGQTRSARLPGLVGSAMSMVMRM